LGFIWFPQSLQNIPNIYLLIWNDLFPLPVVDAKGNFRDNMAMTNWCYWGKVQKNPNPVRYNMTKAGWVVAFDMEFV